MKQLAIVGALGIVALVPVSGVAAQLQMGEDARPGGATPTAELRRPPRVEPTDRYSGLVMTLILIACVGVTAGAVLIPGQRTHQD